MSRRAIDGIQDLIDRTGGPKVKATVVVNQIYAQDQHETLYYRHPRGGQAKYLETPLMTKHGKWLQEFATKLLRSNDAAQQWGDVGDGLAGEVPKTAPVEFGDLRGSAGMTVTEGGSIIVDKPPKQQRLSDADLEAKDYMRSMGVGYR